MFVTIINYFCLGGSDTHLFCVDLRSVGLVGSKAEKILEDISIAVNKNACPGDKSALNPSGIRIGSPSLTSRSFTETDMDQVAEFIHQGFQLALEIKKVPCGTTVKDIKEKMRDVVFQEKIKEIKENVEKFAVAFPGLDDM